MLPEKTRLQIYRGDAWQLKTSFFDDAGEAIDFTGATILAQCRESTTLDSGLLFEFRTAIDPDGVVISLLPEDTQEIEQGTYVFDLQIGSRTYLAGQVVLTGDVSRI